MRTKKPKKQWALFFLLFYGSAIISSVALAMYVFSDIFANFFI